MNERLKEALEIRGWTQKTLAERTGISESAICRYVKGERQPKADIIKQICEALEISADWLIWGKEENFPEWISVDDRLPKRYQTVLVWYEYFRYGGYDKMVEDYDIVTYTEKGMFLTHGAKAKVKYWMPLPEPTKERD